ncbi:P-loop NTPase family protein [Enterobacter mori]|uniref:hypothetical protein n=1 Tax=Enterobacter mori TaxID=539813 RepID=UPI002DB73AC2|nr:hypothetical protein [Enterobacter mori]MEB7917484.1 hypothetical protein [Enterobacter mori]
MSDDKKISEQASHQAKKCFVMMPIADHKDYPVGHFQRVYDYLIKPACEKAGLEPYRADDNKASDMIMLDILQKLVECDMAICDISSRNANVFFELGLRQAFNKKTILITDGLQSAPFDISGLRHISYSSDLRVDTVAKEVPAIANMLFETEKLEDNKVNSIINLLQIKPAKVETKDLTPLDTVIFDMFSQLKEQINTLSINSPKPQRNEKISSMAQALGSFGKIVIVSSGNTFEEVYDDSYPTELIGNWQYIESIPNSKRQRITSLGAFTAKEFDALVFNLDGKISRITDNPSNRRNIIAL